MKSTIQLIRSNFNLTGNWSLYVSSENEIEIDTIEDLTTENARRIKVKSDSELKRDIYDLFSTLSDKENAFIKDLNSSPNTPAENLKGQLSFREFMGLKEPYMRDKTGIFAPIWLSDDNLPDKFVIWKVDETDEDILDKPLSSVFTEKSKIVKTFDISSNQSRIGNYLRRHVNDPSFRQYVLRMSYDILPKLNFTGISLHDPGIFEIEDSSNILQRHRPLLDYNRVLEESFRRLGIVSSNLINITWKFTPPKDEKTSRYFGMYVYERESEISLQVNPLEHVEYTNKSQLDIKSLDHKKFWLVEDLENHFDGIEYGPSQLSHSTNELYTSSDSFWKWIKTPENKFFSWSSSSADLSDLSITNLNKSRHLNIRENVEFSDFWEIVRCKVKGQRLISERGEWRQDHLHKLISFPQHGVADNITKQPKITRIISRNEAVVDTKWMPHIKGDMEIAIAIAKPITYGTWDSLPLMDWETSIFEEGDQDFELKNLYGINFMFNGRLEEQLTAKNSFEINGEQDLVINPNNSSPDLKQDYGLLKPRIRWRSLNGTNVKNDRFDIGGWIANEKYNNVPSSVILEGNETKQPSAYAIDSLHTHAYTFLNSTASFDTENVVISLNSFDTFKMGELVEVTHLTDTENIVHESTLMFIGIHADKKTFIPVNIEVTFSDYFTEFSQEAGDIRLNRRLEVQNVTQEPVPSTFKANSISFAPGSGMINDWEIFKSISSNEFDNVFESKEVYSWDGSAIPRHTKRFYGEFFNGSSFSPAETWFKGYKISVWSRSGFTTQRDALKNLRSITPSSNFNGYKFATTLCQDSNLNEPRIRVINNEKFRFIICLICIPSSVESIEDFKSMYPKLNFNRFKTSFSRYLLNQENLNREKAGIDFITITETGDKIYDDFYIRIFEASELTVTKRFTTRKLPRDKWPKIFKEKFKDIGTEVVELLHQRQLVKFPGTFFNPSMIEVLQTSQSGETKPQVFITENKDFGKIKDFQIRKFYTQPHRKIEANLPSSSNFSSDRTLEGRDLEFLNSPVFNFPKIGEVDYDWIDLDIFNSQWNKKIFKEFNFISTGNRRQSDQASRIDGKNEVDFVSFPMSSKLLQIDLSSIVIPFSGDITTRRGEFFITFDYNEAIISFLSNRFLNVFDVNLKEIEYRFNSKEDWIRSWIEKNILNLLTINTLTIFNSGNQSSQFELNIPTFVGYNDSFKDIKDEIETSSLGKINATLTKRDSTVSIRISLRDLPSTPVELWGLLTFT